MSSRLLVVGPQYSTAPLPRRHNPRAARPYKEYRACLRLEFTFTCVYCLSTESEVGAGEAYGGFEIDHFKPKGRRDFRRFRNVYANLLWACAACNRAKGDAWPSQEELQRGMRFIEPCSEPMGAHLEIAGDRVTVVAESTAGDYTITEINLNSRQHVMRRQKRRDFANHFALLQAHCEVAEREAMGNPANDGALAQLKRIQRELEELRAKTTPGTRPWDAPEGCSCR